MGAKQTKFHELPESQEQVVLSKITTKQDEELDPRSPHICRTPFSQYKRLAEPMKAPSTTQTENPLGLLRKCLLKGFVFNLNDPRSPTAHLNRTPLIFNDEVVDRTLDLNDTFADLFVETAATTEADDKSTTDGQSHDIEMRDNHESTATFSGSSAAVPSTSDLNDNSHTESFSCVEEEVLSVEEDATMPCGAILKPTAQALLEQLDPRSPTIGVDRTPIIFSDDDEAGEDALLEHILATLSLNMSANSSGLSFGTPTSTPVEDHHIVVETTRATNKHLDVMRVGKKRMPPRNLARIQRQHRQRIYVDTENVTPVGTPKQRTGKTSGSIATEQTRTPLSCVKNRSQLRSRSVEARGKSFKARVSLNSFDDTLNPVQNSMVANLRIMQDSPEFL